MTTSTADSSVPQPSLKEIGDRHNAPMYAPAAIIERGDGVRLFDDQGNEYLDFLAGLAVVRAVRSLDPTHGHRQVGVETGADQVRHVKERERLMDCRRPSREAIKGNHHGRKQ